MRILMTTDTVGGVWTFTRELASGLLDAGCEVTLVSFGQLPNDAQQQWCDCVRRQWGARFHFIADDAPLEWMQQNDRAYAQPASLLLRLAAQRDVDILHSNQFCFGALPIDLPKVVTAHSDVLSWAAACRNGELEDSPWLRQYRSLVQAGIAGAQTIVAPTRWMLDALRVNFELPEEDCRVVPNGRSLPTPPHSPRKLQAVSAGRLWDEAKNAALLVEVRSPIPLLLAGDSSCEASTAPASLGAVGLLGTLAEADLLALFQESEFYLCPSKYEPFGLAPLEAALSGCAVLANDIPSLREVWQGGALYFHDADSLSALLTALRSDPRRRAEARARSYARAQLYSRERMTSAYLSLFEQALTHERTAAHVA